MDPSVAVALRERGVECITTLEAGMLTSKDAALLAYCFAHQRVIVTRDVDFLALHQGGGPHAGIVFVPAKYALGPVIRFLLLIHEVLAAADLMNQVEFASL